MITALRSLRRAGAAALAALWLAAFMAAAAEEVPAPEPPVPAPRELSAEEKQQAFLRLARELQEAFRAKDYEKALKLCDRQTELLPRLADPHYNRACAQARLGKSEEAFAALAKAIELGFTDADHIRADEDLAALRADKRLEELAGKAAESAKRAEERFYEKGEEIEGVKTLEGHPEGGLRWRLRLGPEATAEKPHRLIVWLHPSGGSMNRVVERMAPQLAKHGYALLVVSQKQWLGWSEAEGRRLFEKTVPDAGKTPGVDARRPLLMGFSAGGQAALVAYFADPGRFGGLILDAAYPLDMAEYARGKPAVQKLPDDKDRAEAFKKTPIFAVVGTADGGAQLWKAAEEPYRTAGMPLTMIYVKDGKHAWLIRKPEFAALCAWLDQIAEGKLPDQKTVPYEPAGASGDKPAPPATEPPAGKPPAPAQPAGPEASGQKPAHTVYDGWPFDAQEAARRQKETAEKTGLPAERAVDVGDGVKLEFVLVPAGEFEMGSTEKERGLPSDKDEAPVHRVRITRPFYLGRCEVTQEAWEKVAGANPSRFQGAHLPVESVSWNDVQAFLKKANAALAGKTVLRLPTEAEWEYACRAGSAAPYHFGDDVEKIMKDHAWFEWNAGGKSHPVGEKKPNAWGLCDMHGNVWEWCDDVYEFGYYAKSPKDDPAGPAEGKARAVRGGAWYNGPGSCRAANRWGFDPAGATPLYGFRLAMDAAATER